MSEKNDKWTIESKPINLYYSSEAWLKLTYILWHSNLEIAWNMVVKPYKDGYKIYDMLIYPQKVYQAKVEIDEGKYGLWKCDLTPDQDENLFGQAHSHVNMMVSPSTEDMRNQREEIEMKKYGFLLFQIYNKHGDIWSRLYDLDNHSLCQTFNYIIEIGDSTLDLFIDDINKKVIGDKDESKQVV